MSIRHMHIARVIVTGHRPEVGMTGRAWRVACPPAFADEFQRGQYGECSIFDGSAHAHAAVRFTFLPRSNPPKGRRQSPQPPAIASTENWSRSVAGCTRTVSTGQQSPAEVHSSIHRRPPTPARNKRFRRVPAPETVRNIRCRDECSGTVVDDDGESQRGLSPPDQIISKTS